MSLANGSEESRLPDWTESAFASIVIWPRGFKAAKLHPVQDQENPIYFV
jgi:hypothetical protein